MKLPSQQKIAKRRILEISQYTIVAFFLSISGAQIAFGAPYTPLVNLPGVASTGQGLGAYFNQLYMATVAIGAILAFIKIAFAGAKYSMSGVVTDKETAKNDIKGALFGLAILLIPFIVLNTIYPNLTSLNILQNAGNMKVDLTKKAGAGAGADGLTNVPVDPVSALAPANSAVANPVVKGCRYTQINTPSGVGMNGETTFVTSYDKTACLQECAELMGTFRESFSAGECTYIEVQDAPANNPSTLPGA